MTWLTWRQLRTQAAFVYAAVAAAVLTLALTAHSLPKVSPAGSIFDRLSRPDRDLYYAGVIVLALAPAVIGAFWGAPMVARELENGTHRFVWTQSVSRTRWLVTRLGLTALAAAAGVGALTFAVTWWSGPVDGALSSTHGSLPSRLTPVVFAMRGVVPVAYAVFAVALGVTLGVVLRRSLPAMALTLAIFAAVQITFPLWVRPHLMPAKHEVAEFSLARLDGINGDPNGKTTITLNTGHAGSWVLSNQTVDRSGRPSALPSFGSSCFAAPPPPTSAPDAQPVQGPDVGACLTRLNAEGYRQRITYLSADAFWPLQLVETAVYLVVAGLLAGLSIWWTRRRLS